MLFTENEAWSSGSINPTYKIICTVIGQLQGIKHQTCQKLCPKNVKFCLVFTVTRPLLQKMLASVVKDVVNRKLLGTVSA